MLYRRNFISINLVIIWRNIRGSFISLEIRVKNVVDVGLIW